MLRVGTGTALTLLVAAAAFGGVTAAASRPRLEPISTESRPTPINAYRGRLVWSSYDSRRKGYVLKLARRGRVETLPIRPRRAPFDVDLGPGSDGRVVAVYSRCRRERETAYYPPRGCDVYRYDFASRKETRIRQLSRRGVSEYLPSLWKNRIAFARLVERGPGRSAVPRIYARDLQSRHTGPLPGGPFPSAFFSTGPTALELRGRHLAYTWESGHASVVRPASFAAARMATRVRLVTTDGRVDRTLARRYSSLGELSFVTPSFEGRWLYVGFLGPRASAAYRYPLGRGRPQRARVPDPVVALQRDRGLLFVSKGEDREASSGEPCSIGVTDFILGGSPPRICTVGRVEHARFHTFTTR